MKVSIDFDSEKIIFSVTDDLGEEATEELDVEDALAMADALRINAGLLKQVKNRRDTDAEWDIIGGAN